MSGGEIAGIKVHLLLRLRLGVVMRAIASHAGFMPKVIVIMVTGVSLAMVIALMVAIEPHMVPAKVKGKAKEEEKAKVKGKVKVKARVVREYLRQRKPLSKQPSSTTRRERRAIKPI